MPVKKGSAEHVISTCSSGSEGKAPYDLEREANIRRNRQVLASIGLVDGVIEPTPRAGRKRNRAQSAVQPEAQPLRRSLRSCFAVGSTPAPDAQQIAGDLPANLDNRGASRHRSLSRGSQLLVLHVEDEVEDEVDVDPNPARPPNSQQFARRVYKCIKRIPYGMVASYGQLAAMAGLPRNARQVGAMLKEGLCNGGLPWWRVINSGGKISLPPAGGGELQRQKLEAEGVHFRDNGAVDDETFWDP